MLVSMPSVSIGVRGLSALPRNGTQQAVDELVIVVGTVFLTSSDGLVDGDAGLLLLAVQHLRQSKAQGNQAHAGHAGSVQPFRWAVMISSNSAAWSFMAASSWLAKGVWGGVVLGGHGGLFGFKRGGKCRQKGHLAGLAAGQLFSILKVPVFPDSLLFLSLVGVGQAHDQNIDAGDGDAGHVLDRLLDVLLHFLAQGMTLLPYTTVRCTVTVAMPSSMTTVTGFCRPVRPRSERTFWLVPVATSATPSTSSAARRAILR